MAVTTGKIGPSDTWSTFRYPLHRMNLPVIFSIFHAGPPHVDWSAPESKIRTLLFGPSFILSSQSCSSLLIVRSGTDRIGHFFNRNVIPRRRWVIYFSSLSDSKWTGLPSGICFSFSMNSTFLRSLVGVWFWSLASVVSVSSWANLRFRMLGVYFALFPDGSASSLFFLSFLLKLFTWSMSPWDNPLNTSLFDG